MLGVDGVMEVFTLPLLCFAAFDRFLVFAKPPFEYLLLTTPAGCQLQRLCKAKQGRVPAGVVLDAFL